MFLKGFVWYIIPENYEHLRGYPIFEVKKFMNFIRFAESFTRYGDVLFVLLDGQTFSKFEKVFYLFGDFSVC